MGDPIGDDAWSMRLQYKPLVRFIWGGAIVIALGGLIAACDRRYRQRVPARDVVPASKAAETV
jgi:cytochrome c-type biogenesis protein CcmF